MKRYATPSFSWQLLKHVDDLRLNGNVQRGDRLVADDELRLYRQCAGDADTLTLTAGQLMRETVGKLLIQTDLAQQVGDAVALFLFGQMEMNVHSLGNDFADGHAGVQGSVWVLEDDLDVLAELQQILPLRVEMSLPSNTTLPEVGSYSFIMVRPQVVLPQPDSPTSPRVSPRLIDTVT